MGGSNWSKGPFRKGFSHMTKKLALWIVFVSSLVFVGEVVRLTVTHASLSRLKASTIKTTVVSSSAHPLHNLFDGLSPDPRYSIKAMADADHKRQKCGAANAGPSSVLEKVFGVTVAYAQCSCSSTDCNGNGWVGFTNYCNTGSPCSGAYADTTTDPVNGCGWGAEFDGGNCGSDPCCGCSSFACPNNADC